MSRVAYTIRIDESDDEALSLIAKLLKKSKNQLIVAAVRDLIGAQSKQIADDMDALSGKLKAYAARDPGFDKAIAAFAEAEGKHEDPLEGEVVKPGSSILDQVGNYLKDA